MVELQLQVVELEKNNFHILVESTVNNETIYWIIDTGASKSVFDINLDDLYQPIEPDPEEEFKSAGINLGPIDTKLGKVSLKIGSIEINNLSVALINMEHISEIYKKYSDQKIGGLLGGDVLEAYGCCINYREKTISFNPEK